MGVEHSNVTRPGKFLEGLTDKARSKVYYELVPFVGKLLDKAGVWAAVEVETARSRLANAERTIEELKRDLSKATEALFAARRVVELAEAACPAGVAAPGAVIEVEDAKVGVVIRPLDA